MNKDGKDYEEQVDVDTEKQTETFRVSKTSPDDEAGEIVYDFKKVITWLRCSCTVLHILQVILMSVDQGLSCAVSVTSVDVSVAVNYNLSWNILGTKLGKAKKSTAYVSINFKQISFEINYFTCKLPSLCQTKP